jgi:hypothetical protein
MRANTKKFKVLEAIGRSPNGLRFSEIQRVAVELAGHDFDEFRVEDAFVRYDSEKRESVFGLRTRRRWRGFWCTNLVYSGAPGGGILNQYCEKVNGRWVLKASTRAELAEAEAKAKVKPLLTCVNALYPVKWDTWS